mgnify:CR=1 FL=1
MSDSVFERVLALMLIVGCLFLIFAIASAGMNYGKDQIRSEAVKANVGEFYLDDNRTIQFRWKIK